jgi:hypothetical protein
MFKKKKWKKKEKIEKKKKKTKSIVHQTSTIPCKRYMSGDISPTFTYYTQNTLPHQKHVTLPFLFLLHQSVPSKRSKKKNPTAQRKNENNTEHHVQKKKKEKKRTHGCVKARS